MSSEHRRRGFGRWGRAWTGHCTPILYASEAGETQLVLPGSFFLDAYAAGLNRYAELHPKEAERGLFPASGLDLLAGFVQKPYEPRDLVTAVRRALAPSPH